MGRININAIRRRQIVDAAVRVMGQRGWNETSIDEITKEAGVSRGLVSYHFKDKSELLSGVLARCQEIHSEAVDEAAAMTEDPTERVRLTTRTAIYMIRDNPLPYEVFLHFAAGARSIPELGDQIRALYGGFRRVTAEGIRRGQAKGAFRTDIDAEAASARHIGAITGLALQWLLDPNAYPFEEAARQTEEMLLAYIAIGAQGKDTAAASEVAGSRS